VFSIMARPADFLERLPDSLGFGAKSRLGGQVRLGAANVSSRLPAGLALGWPELEACLPDAGLARGHVVQLAALHPGALTTTLALKACAQAQQQGHAVGTDEPWCAFIDPSKSLHAPGVAEFGLRLDRLLVVTPEPQALANVALRVVRSGVFAVVVIDGVGGLGEGSMRSLGIWVRIIRQMALALEGQHTVVLLLTDASSLQSPLPLPVAQRIELRRNHPSQLELRVAKDRWGRITGWKRVQLGNVPEPSLDRNQKPAFVEKQEVKYAT
jgi:hypothetical protein